MSDKSATTIDVSSLVNNIRQEINRRTGQSMTSPPYFGYEAGLPAELAGNLRSLKGEWDALNSEVQAGEPQPAGITFRGRFGVLLKRRLYRFLWWQSHALRTAVNLFTRWAAAEEKLIEALLQNSSGQGVRDVQQEVSEFKNRLRQLESAQLRLQASEIERNVRQSVQQVDQFAERLGFESAQREQLAERLRVESGQREQLAERLGSESAQREQLAERLGLESAQREQLAERLGLESAQREQLAERLGLESAQREQLAERLSALAQKLEGNASLAEQLAGRLSELERSTSESSSVLAQRFDGVGQQAQQLTARLSELGLFTHQTRAGLSIQDRRLSLLLEEFRKQTPNHSPLELPQNAESQHTKHRFDSLYAAFEDVFRGSREEIKARQAVYLPLLKEHGVGSPSMPLLDLGCGRGEFLELLGENGIEARGVDLNEEMVDRCKSLGLPVVSGDALPYLRSLPDACLGALTAFHMVEHMPFEVVLDLVDESLRVLKQGGVLILETPNPANVLVGSHTFYLDPTHLKPLPSPMLRFFVEGRGFCNVIVRELHPYPEVVRLPQDGGVSTRMNDLLYGPQDYAVIGRKP